MISDSGGGSKIRLIGRRMFILTAAKAVVVFGVVGRLISLQINESKKYKTLSDKNGYQLYIPKGFAHGYLSLNDTNLVYFQNSTYRDKNQEKGILWNDTNLNVKLPIKKPLISKKDQLNMSLKSFQKNYKHI